MKKHSIGRLELETAVLECFLEKTPLSPLGVNLCHISLFRNGGKSMSVNFEYLFQKFILF
jgi:hypothetical protein